MPAILAAVAAALVVPPPSLESSAEGKIGTLTVELEVDQDPSLILIWGLLEEK